MAEIVKTNEIEKIIYEIRGKQVMLDSDLARLYHCKNGTKSVNLAVKRNVERFPEDFYFQLTIEEFNRICGFNMKPQNNKIRSLPYVFTEQGVAMLATILRTEVAAQMSISIMRAFVSMRRYISNNLLEQRNINNQVLKNTEDIKILQETFKKFEAKKKTNEIYYSGQIYDAYSTIKKYLMKQKKN